MNIGASLYFPRIFTFVVAIVALRLFYQSTVLWSVYVGYIIKIFLYLKYVLDIPNLISIIYEKINKLEKTQNEIETQKFV